MTRSETAEKAAQGSRLTGEGDDARAVGEEERLGMMGGAVNRQVEKAGECDDLLE